MEGESISINNLHKSKNSVEAINILVVDDDATCLSIVASMLKKFNYEVVTVKHPNDALCTLRIKNGAFDLVISDVYMPDINGFELQQTITQEFNLPVVLMSVDDKETVALKGLENGAAFFIVKPVSPNDLKDLWQFAAMKKRSKVVINEIENSQEEENNSNNKTIRCVSSFNEKKKKRESNGNDGLEEKGGETSRSGSQKKPKIVWSNSLHNRFLEAIRSIGLERAVPKKILEVMNVPGLTRENVASHLQKYRIFLKRVSDASCHIQSSAEKGSSSKKTLQSNFVPSIINPSIAMVNKFNQLHNQNSSLFSNTSSSFASHELSSNTDIPYTIFGQSRLLFDTQNLSGINANLIPHSNHVSLRLMQSQTDPSIHQTSVIHVQNQTNPPSILQSSVRLVENQTNPLIQGGGSLSHAPVINDFSTGFDHGSLMGPGPGPNRFNQNINDEIPSINVPSPSPPKNSNYVGYQLPNIRPVVESTRDQNPNGSNSWIGTTSCLENTMSVPMSSNENIITSIDLDLLAQVLGVATSPSSPILVHDQNNNGEPLSHVKTDYDQNLLQRSSLALTGNLENGEGNNQGLVSNINQMFEFPEYNQSLEEGDLNSIFNIIENTQNAAQGNEGENNGTTSNLFEANNQWSINIITSSKQTPIQIEQQGHESSTSFMQEFGNPSQLHQQFPASNEEIGNFSTNILEFGSFSQLIRAPDQSITNQNEEDEFLESLLVAVPYGEDQTF